MFNPPLFAAGDVWGFLLGIVFLAIYAINHFISAAKTTPPPQNRKQPRKPPGQERPLRPKPSQPARQS